MTACKKCGEITTKLHHHIGGYWCQYCGDLAPSEVYSEKEIYEEWVEYRYLCFSPAELREILTLELRERYKKLAKTPPPKPKPADIVVVKTGVLPSEPKPPDVITVRADFWGEKQI